MNERIVYDETVFTGDITEVHRIGLRMADGRVVRRDLIHYGGAAVVLPLLGDGSIAMIRNYRFAVDEQLLELPAGLLEEAEPPELCAARELTEETGYTAGRIEKLGRFFTGPGTTDEVMHAYLATDLTDGRQKLETYEEITVEVLSQRDVRRMVADGEIHDAKTIATLALYWLKTGAGS